MVHGAFDKERDAGLSQLASEQLSHLEDRDKASLVHFLVGWDPEAVLEAMHHVSAGWA